VKRSIPVLFVVLAGLASTACGASSGDRVARDLTAVQKERTPDKLVARGVAFAGVGDLTRAEQYLAAALDAGADPEVVLPKLMRVCIAAGHERAAIDYAAPQLRKHPGDAHLQFVVGELRALTGDASGAREDLEHVVNVDPQAAAPRYALARLLRDQVGDVVAADREFRAYLRLSPSGEHAEEARASLLQAVVAARPSRIAREVRQ
jgi:thioredoxin-like negative regulator of GroEL